MKYFEHGRPIYKHLDIKVIVGNKTFPLHYRATSGKFYSEEEIETEIARIIDHIDKNFPTLEFRQVIIVPNRINFIAIGKRKVYAAEKSEEQVSVDTVSDRGEQANLRSPSGVGGQERRQAGAGNDGMQLLDAGTEGNLDGGSEAPPLPHDGPQHSAAVGTGDEPELQRSDAAGGSETREDHDVYKVRDDAG